MRLSLTVSYWDIREQGSVVPEHNLIDNDYKRPDCIQA